MESGSEASIEVIAVAVPGGALAVEHVTAATEPGAGHPRDQQPAQTVELAARAAPRPDPDRPGPARPGRQRRASPARRRSSRHAADLIAVLDHLGLDAVPVCGMSMGGFVAVELADRYPDRVDEPGPGRRRLPDGDRAGPDPEAVPAIFARPARPAGPGLALGGGLRQVLRRADRAAARPGRPTAAGLPGPRSDGAPGPAELRRADSGRDRHLLRSHRRGSSSRCRPGCSPRSGVPGRTARPPTRRRSSSSSATHWGHRARWSAWKPWRVSITPRRS